MSILVIAEHDNSELHVSTLNTVTAASKMGDDVQVLVAGSGCGDVAAEAAKISGVSKVLHADAEHYKDGVSVGTRHVGFLGILQGRPLVFHVLTERIRGQSDPKSGLSLTVNRFNGTKGKVP